MYCLRKSNRGVPFEKYLKYIFYKKIALFYGIKVFEKHQPSSSFLARWTLIWCMHSRCAMSNLKSFAKFKSTYFIFMELKTVVLMENNGNFL